LVEATDIAAACRGLEQATGHDLNTESGRYRGRDLIAALLRPWFAARDLSEIRRTFAGTSVSWGPYQTFHQLIEEDPRCSTANPMFAEVDHPGIGTYLMPGSPLDFSAVQRLPVRRAPLLGEHTDEVLAEVLGLSGGEIARLRDKGVVAGVKR
ncbi:MAG: CoA transferase, partial [Candidatus Binataceae bacterium]